MEGEIFDAEIIKYPKMTDIWMSKDGTLNYEKPTSQYRPEFKTYIVINYKARISEILEVDGKKLEYKRVLWMSSRSEAHNKQLVNEYNTTGKIRSLRKETGIYVPID